MRLHVRIALILVMFLAPQRVTLGDNPDGAVVLKAPAPLGGRPRPRGQSTAVRWLAFSADGRRLVVWSAESTGAVYLWSLPDRKVIYQSGKVPVREAPLVSRERLVLKEPGLGANAPVRWILRDLGTGEVKGEVKRPKIAYTRPFTQALSADGKLMAEVSLERPDPRAPVRPLGPRPPPRKPDQVVVYDIATGEVRQTLTATTRENPLAGLPGQAESPRTLSVAFSPDASRLAAYTADGTITVWDVPSGEEAAILRGDTLPIRFLLPTRNIEVAPLTWLTDNTTLVTPPCDGLAPLQRGFPYWDTPRQAVSYRSWRRSKTDLLKQQVPHDHILLGAVSPDGSRAVWALRPQTPRGRPAATIEIIDMKAGAVLGKLPFPEGYHVTDLAFSPDASHVAVGTHLGDVLIFDSKTIK